MTKRKTISEFIEEARKVHGDYYDFSRSIYLNAHTKLEVGCPKHGIFKIAPHELLHGQGCKYCGNERRAENAKLKLDDFISRSTIIHNGKYEYYLVELEDYKKNVKIVCPIHGVFEQSPRNHLQGYGCKKCALEYTSQLFSDTKEDFVEKARIVHGDKYDYSRFVYLGSKVDGDIICPIHGIFPQKPCHHLNGSGCPKCSNGASKNETEIIDMINNSYNVYKNMDYREKYIERCRKVHGDKYIYTEVGLSKMKDKVKIICPEHGEFEQRADAHLGGQGCPICGNIKMGISNSSNVDEFTEKANKIHSKKYVYYKSIYINNSTPLCITCPQHGDFWQTPSNHLKGEGCPKCNGGVRLELTDFINKGNKAHNFKYDYSEFDYATSRTKGCIICPIHGKFWQMPNAHLNGEGCPKCSNIGSKYEEEISNSLKGLEIQQRNRKLLNGKEIDIYLPQYKLGIEFNGLYWHSEENGKDKDYHLNKLNMCNENGIELIQIFEDEWIDKREICETIIKDEIALNNNEILCADSCNIAETNNEKEVNVFLNKNSIYGIDECYNIAISAYYNDNIVGVMTLKKDSENEYTLNRFTTNIKYNCDGLKDEMLNYFKEKYTPSKITYFADRRWVTHINNNLYTNLGFKVNSFIEPTFKYYKKNTRFGRINQDKVTDENGYTRIWDCGQVKYVYSK